MIRLRRRRRHPEPTTTAEPQSNVRVLPGSTANPEWATLAAELDAELRDFRDYGRRLTGGRP